MTSLQILAAAPLAIVAVTIFLRTGLRHPAIALAVFAAVVPIGSAVALPGLPGAFGTLSSFVGLLTIVVLVGYLATSRQRATHLTQAAPVWMLLVAWAGLTVSWSIEPIVSMLELIVLLSLIGLFIPASLVRIPRGQLEHFETGIIAGGVIAGLIAAVQLATGTLHVEAGTGVPRFSLAGGGGTVGDANVTAATLLLPLTVALGLFVQRADTSRRRQLFGGIGVVAIVFALILTGSRGGLVAVPTLLLVLLLTGRGSSIRPSHAVAALVFLAAGLMISPDAIQQRVQQPGSTGRADIWLVSLASCPEYCVIGSGQGTFPMVQAEGWLSDPRGGGYEFGYQAHNIFLQALVETGIPGLGLLVAGLWLTARQLWRLAPSVRAGPLAALASVVVANLFLSNFAFKYFWLVLIYSAVVTVSHQSDERSSTAGTTVRPEPDSRLAWMS